MGKYYKLLNYLIIQAVKSASATLGYASQLCTMLILATVCIGGAPITSMYNLCAKLINVYGSG